MEVLESQIEDILVSSPSLLKSMLNLKEAPSLLTRQMMIPSGRLDLLLAYQTRLLLVELKVIAFRHEFVRQVLNYKSDLLTYQASGKLLCGDIQPYLLCASASETQRRTSATSGVMCFDYNPEHILQYFFQNLRPIAFFAEIKPIDIGIWNLHLIHDFIYLLEEVKSVSQLRSLVKGSSKTLYNKIKFANELRLIEWRPNQDSISLSKLGFEYVKRKDNTLSWRLSDAQIELLRKLVMQNPYESSVILGVASIVEATFALARNTYPVPMSWLIEYFSYYAGKYFDWQTKKAKYNATRMYSNYAVDLGLLAKSGESVYITPDGFRFVIQLQLHKSLKMMQTIWLLSILLCFSLGVIPKVVGNTLEDLLGIQENNLPIPNASEWELKCQRAESSSLTTLFHIEPSPRALKFVPAVLLPKYGWEHDLAGSKHPKNEMSFRQTIHGMTCSDRGFKVVVDRKSRRVLVSFDAMAVDPRHSDWLESVRERVGLGELDPQPYWGFDDLYHKAGTKLLNCFYVQVEVKREHEQEFFHYNRVLILQGFSFDNFLIALEEGNVLVDFDARTGHNHGTKFRLRQNARPKLYSRIQEVV